MGQNFPAEFGHHQGCRPKKEGNAWKKWGWGRSASKKRTEVLGDAPHITLRHPQVNIYMYVCLMGTVFIMCIALRSLIL